MKVENASSHPLRKLRPLIEFCIARAPIAVNARLRLMDGETGKTTGGLAHFKNPSLKDPVAPSLVEIWLGTSTTYPRLDQHVQELEPIRLDSWEEEVLLVIAHEFRHIQQMYAPIVLVRDDHEAEVDAEAFAIETLNAWREIRLSRAA